MKSVATMLALGVSAVNLSDKALTLNAIQDYFNTLAQQSEPGNDDDASIEEMSAALV